MEMVQPVQLVRRDQMDCVDTMGTLRDGLQILKGQLP